MSDDPKLGLRHHAVAGARDVLVVCSVISLLISVAALLLKPYWEPFAKLPQEVAETQRQIAKLQLSVADGLKPRIVDFQGVPTIAGEREIFAGQSISLLFSLRRNASCDTEISRTFFNVDRGVSVVTDIFNATKAPVTESYIVFKLDILVPKSVMPGRYVYVPTLTPVECGVYGPIQAPPSEIFTVKDTSTE